MKTRTLDLFAGCGGMSLGFQLENYDIVEAHDNWKPAVDCYSKNFGHPIYETDLSDYQRVVPLIIDKGIQVIIGGPPCQEFSSAGKRVEKSKADLTTTFASIVAATKPLYFVMENVDRALKSTAYRSAKKTFIDAGYGLTEIVLNAAQCGVPQRRKRFFSIGGIKEPQDFLLPILHGTQSRTEMTLRDYFGDTLDIEYYYRHPRNYNRRGIFSIDEPSPTVRGVNRPVPDGYKGHHADPIKKYKWLRALTTKERSMVQTFPNDFCLPDTKTDCEQLIGNAVPVNLAKFVAKSLQTHIKENSTLA
jgi:DNA (cytosine-5)-methyltransferase 1